MKRVYIDVEAIKDKVEERKTTMARISLSCGMCKDWLRNCLRQGFIIERSFSKVCAILDCKPEELKWKPKPKSENPVSQPCREPANYQSHIEIDGKILTLYLLKDGLPQCSGIAEMESDSEKDIMSAIINASYAARMQLVQNDLKKKRRESHK